MDVGGNQVCRYGVEVSHGTTVTPTTTFGLVVGGSIREAQRVYLHHGLDYVLPWETEYGRTEYAGSLRLLLQDMDIFNTTYGASPLALPLPSYTMDIGATYAGVPPRRYSGVRFGSCRVDCRPDDVLYIDLEFGALACGDGTLAAHNALSYPLWQARGITLMVGAVEVAELQSLTFDVRNSLEPIYLATPVAVTPRAPKYLRVGRRELSCSFSTFDRLAPTLRNLAQNHADTGVAISLSLYDFCSTATAEIILIGAYQTSLLEPLAPNEAVEYEYEWVPRELMWVG